MITLRGPNSPRRGPQLQELSIIEDGSILLKDGLIFALGSTRRIENMKEAKGAFQIAVPDKVIMPGFVDAGLTMSMFLGHGQKRKKGTVFYDECLAVLRSCLQHGTVMAEIRAQAGAHEEQTILSAMRLLSKVKSNPVPILRTWLLAAGEAERASLASLQVTLAELARKRLADFVEIDTRSTPREYHDGLAEASLQHRFEVKLDVSGAPLDGLADVLAKMNPRTVRLPIDIAEHLHETLCRLPGLLVFSPSHAVGGSFQTSQAVRRLADAGAAIALASGHDPRYATSVSMQMAVALGVMALHLTLEEAISAATINSAWALGCADRVGSLEVGKKADLIVMNFADYRELLRQYGVNHVAMVIRDGTVVFNRLKTMRVSAP